MPNPDWVTLVLETDGNDAWKMEYIMIFFTDNSYWKCANPHHIWVGEGELGYFHCELVRAGPGRFHLSPELVNG